MLTRQALRDKAMQGMLDVLNDAGTKSEIKVTAGVTLMDMLLKDAQLEQHEAQVAYYKKMAEVQALQGEVTGTLLAEKDLDRPPVYTNLNSGRVS